MIPNKKTVTYSDRIISLKDGMVLEAQHDHMRLT